MLDVAEGISTPIFSSEVAVVTAAERRELGASSRREDVSEGTMPGGGSITASNFNIRRS